MFRPIKLVFAFVALVSIGGLAGCAQPPLPQDHYYRLSVPLPDQRFDAPLLDGSLQVERFAAEGVLSGRPLVYSKPGDKNELLEYYYHFWMEPPAVMMQNQFIKFMRNANVSETIVTPDMRINPAYIMTGKIRRMERIVDDNQVAFEVEVGLREAATNKVISLDIYGMQGPAEGSTVKDAVKAMDQLLAKVFQRVIDDMKKGVDRHKGA